MSIASFAAGFVSGWILRSTVESSRGLAVNLGASYQELARRIRRVLVAEREFLEDLWAEARARTSAEAEAEEAARPRASGPREASRADGEAAS